MSSGCKCGADCKCGSDCKCGEYRHLAEEKSTTTQTMIMGVAPQKGHVEGFEMAAGSEDGGCKCNPCNCNPCNCK